MLWGVAQVLFVLVEEDLLWITPWDVYQAAAPDMTHVPLGPMRS